LATCAAAVGILLGGCDDGQPSAAPDAWASGIEDGGRRDVPDAEPPVDVEAPVERIDVPTSDAPTADDVRFEVELPIARVQGDGVSMVPVLVKAFHADGKPAAVRVALQLSRPKAGFVRPRIAVTGGAQPLAWFTPCLQSEPDCLGPVKVQLAPASASADIVAESSVVTVEPVTGVNTSAPCVLGGNTIFADNFFFRGARDLLLIREGVFSTVDSARGRIVIRLNPGQLMSSDLSLTFTAVDQQLKVGVYGTGTGAPAPAVSRMPGRFEISIPNRSCAYVAAFQIEKLVWAGNQLDELLATFEAECSAYPDSQPVHGCVYFRAPDDPGLGP
jgi:hypothetical protein